MTFEEMLAGWTGPSSDTEQDKQERTERMVREAVSGHPAFSDCSLKVYAKGSYPNNTNVRADSDVDIGVQCQDVFYWDKHPDAAAPSISSYQGIWTSTKLRSELVEALKAKFGDDVDTTGSTAIRVHSSSARVDADVVPCFSYRYYSSNENYWEGAKTFKKDGTSLVNYPDQHLRKGRDKNNGTNQDFKKLVRIMKRVENAMFEKGTHPAVPSYFVECLVYNCPDSIIKLSTWAEAVRGLIVHLWDQLDGEEPVETAERWLEVNEVKFLFHSAQPWTRVEGRAFAKAAWNHLGFTS